MLELLRLLIEQAHEELHLRNADLRRLWDMGADAAGPEGALAIRLAKRMQKDALDRLQKALSDFEECFSSRYRPMP